MTDFKNLQSIWNQQGDSKTAVNSGDIIQKSEAHFKKIKSNQRWIILILSITLIVLLIYFGWVLTHQIDTLFLGLSLMVGMLFFRVVLEVFSIYKLRSIRPINTLNTYTEQLKSYYQWRKYIHFLLTPVIYISYTVGFILLLPTFNLHFSRGFYLYCLISGFLFLILMALIIIRSIRKELKQITHLNSIME